jgi:glycosyltransferase involved in cell wall biosynthesis
MLKIALFLPSLRGGGAERVMLNLAKGFAARGVKVDLVLAKAEGPYLAEVPPEVRVIDLKAPRVLASLPGLVRYLRRERPAALLSAMDHANVVALWARRFSGVSTRVVVSIHTTTSLALQNSRQIKARLTPYLARCFYSDADAIVAVSKGVAEDLVRITGMPAARIHVIYNPVVTPEVFARAKEPVEHPWFDAGQPPVILGVGRLTKPKDFPTLMRAFALVRRERPARLMILGEGEERPRLEALIKELGLEDDVALPGFVDNPYAYMARAAVFVLSSAWEGLPTVLVEAMACGCPVVSTDCPSGPAEILEGGKYGPLVPVGDAVGLSHKILTVLNTRINQSEPESWIRFSLDTATKKYSRVLLDER